MSRLASPPACYHTQKQTSFGTLLTSVSMKNRRSHNEERGYRDGHQGPVDMGLEARVPVKYARHQHHTIRPFLA